ncbi:RF-1 and RF-2 N5-glutamine methyltransferase [Erysipelotrichaceae bacterium]|nr:RF-1 and RF-2 N5-glutamine methyltransferase [Erysipelotrichaceae bacterium]
MKIQEILTQAESMCKQENIAEHPARILLMDVLNLESYQLYAKLEEDMAEDKKTEYFQKLTRYTKGNEPIQYIIGYEYFAGRNLIVGPKALIPRPETEELVHEVLFLLDDFFSEEAGYQTIDVVDIGTGSGAIAVSIAAEEPRTRVIATDISQDALEVTKANTEKFNLNIELLQGDMVKPVIAAGKKVDVLLANPPYIPKREYVQSIVKDNEPNIALFGGEDGLQFYREILMDAHKILMPKYLLAFEIGYDQAERLSAFARTQFPSATIYIKKDMQQKDRMLFIHNF